MVAAMGLLAVGAVLGGLGGGRVEASNISAVGVPSVFTCSPGSYISLNLCKPAPLGAFVSGINAVTFTLCNAGAYQDQLGQTSCKPAPAGSFVSAVGQYEFIACSPGTYQDMSAQTSCKPAPLGYFVAGTGAVTPIKCSPGTTTLVTGSTACSAIVVPPPPPGGSDGTSSDVNNNVPLFVPVSPYRVTDTRGGARVGSADGAAGPLKIKVTGQGGLPATGVAAVSLNVTVVDGGLPSVGGGFVTVDGCNSPRPDASNLNFGGGQTVPNSAITPVSATGEVCVYVYGTAHILVDINGYFPVT